MSHFAAVLSAIFAGGLAGLALGLWADSTAQALAQRTSALTHSLISAVNAVVAPLRRAERVGTRASSRERSRLAILGAATGAVLGWLVTGVAGSIVCAAVMAAAMPRVLDWRAERYRRRVDQGAAGAALALAGALSGGHTVRASFGVIAGELKGPVAVELSHVAAELALGERTQSALEGLRERVRSTRIDMIVAAVLIQRRSGGDLATLLRGIADTIAEQDRLRDEARAASSQARFTANLVIAMPFAAIALGELASPGLVGQLMASTIGLSLLGVALAFQILGAVMVWRFARVPT
ncbi:MAG: type II secretion system F family protein [Solirubrobacterales bacterium]